MSLVINNNSLASRTASGLSTSYAQLAKSTQRLSSGLRINSAADDAAGLAIRELMRSDITAMKQGIRNANDAISMLQTTDGALAIIDEKLIRMKELAEQAATGTYNSVQRAMIDSEFQQMASEIDRIARATDFNGIKLLDGNYSTTSTASTQGTATSTDGTTTYDINTPIDLENGTSSRTAQATALEPVINSGSDLISPENYEGTTTVTVTNTNTVNRTTSLGNVTISVEVTGSTTGLPDNLDVYYNGSTWAIATAGYTETSDIDDYNNIANYYMTGTNAIYLNIGGNSHASIYLTASNLSNVTGYNNAVNVPLVTGEIPQYNYKITYANGSTLEGIVGETGSAITNTWSNNSAEFTIDLGNGNEISQTVSLSGTRNAYTIKNFTITLNVAKQSSSDSGGSDSTSVSEDIPDNVVKIHFGSGNDSAEDYYYINKSDATTSGLGLSGVSIETQENAQKALVTIKDAIVKKDNIRAYYGAMQNRLENTMSNLTTQSENLQTAESRISDIDIAKEMTNFVKNQILTQAAVAMLSQANVMPQMAMRLIG